jgi:mono/diheme cytochrome c family protein
MKPDAPRFSSSLGLLVFSLLLAVALTGCPKKADPKPNPLASAQDAGGAAPLASSQLAPSQLANAGHGKELVLTYECNRCHDGTGHPAAAQGKHCVHCHKDIIEDRFTASAASIARWKPRVKELADAPSLEATGKRFTRRWVEGYLLQPSDLRPHLQQYMPRLAISLADARDIAAYLVPEADPTAGDPAKAPEIAGADLGKGRQLLETKGCGSCHVMTGVAALPSSNPPAMDGKAFERAHKLAPDLVHARTRMPAARLIAWLKDPTAVKADSAMPKIVLTDAEVKDIAGYLLAVELSSPPKKPRPARLPLLTRKVTFKEVDDKVFHRTCWHCHSEPDYAIGDGGPGNSGGLGFKPRGLNLSAYEGIAAGFLDDKNERQSVFAKDGEGVPRLVRAMLARYDEEAGAATGEVRGMPLGYDPISMEEIQLVDTWISQGRPR